MSKLVVILDLELSELLVLVLYDDSIFPNRGDTLSLGNSALSSVHANLELAVGVHLAQKVFIVVESSFNRSEGDCALATFQTVMFVVSDLIVNDRERSTVVIAQTSADTLADETLDSSEAVVAQSLVVRDGHARVEALSGKSGVNSTLKASVEAGVYSTVNTMDAWVHSAVKAGVYSTVNTVDAWVHSAVKAGVYSTMNTMDARVDTIMNAGDDTLGVDALVKHLVDLRVDGVTSFREHF